MIRSKKILSEDEFENDFEEDLSDNVFVDVSQSHKKTANETIKTRKSLDIIKVIIVEVLKEKSAVAEDINEID